MSELPLSSAASSSCGPRPRQRALATEVEAGRIQHLDANAVYVVMLDSSTNPSLAGTRDWLSYHLQ